MRKKAKTLKHIFKHFDRRCKQRATKIIGDKYNDIVRAIQNPNQNINGCRAFHKTGGSKNRPRWLVKVDKFFYIVVYDKKRKGLVTIIKEIKDKAHIYKNNKYKHYPANESFIEDKNGELVFHIGNLDSNIFMHLTLEDLVADLKKLGYVTKIRPITDCEPPAYKLPRL